jgi:autotransporter strand-loop-strand O-heptosyltransferase
MKSLGDTIAWFPYVEEFRKKHNCKVVCSTFKNHFFQSLYPEIEFIEPGTPVNNIYAQFNIGWFWDKEKNPSDVLNIPLQQTASDILGLEYKEIKPKLNLKTSTPNIKGKYVTLSVQSTAQSKYWNYKGGWQQVVNFLLKKGYKIVCIDQHSNFGVPGCMNNMPKKVINKTGCDFNEASSLIKNAQFHMGISSGLSWLAWALGTHVVMVSSFTKPFCEFTQSITRIYNDNEFSGYFNTHRIDPNNWHWNPFLNISTPEEWHDFESITPEQVINEIKQIL